MIKSTQTSPASLDKAEIRELRAYHDIREALEGSVSQNITVAHDYQVSHNTQGVLGDLAGHRDPVIQGSIVSHYAKETQDSSAS